MTQQQQIPVERIRGLRLTEEEYGLNWAMADAADAQYTKLLEGLVEWLKEDTKQYESYGEDWAAMRLYGILRGALKPPTELGQSE